MVAKTAHGEDRLTPCMIAPALSVEPLVLGTSQLRWKVSAPNDTILTIDAAENAEDFSDRR